MIIIGRRDAAINRGVSAPNFEHPRGEKPPTSYLAKKQQAAPKAKSVKSPGKKSVKSNKNR